MDKPRDENFAKFLEKLTEQAKRAGAVQLLQVKYEREIAGEDADKREEQLSELADALEKIEESLTGLKVKFDVEPVVTTLENQTELLSKLLEEQSLLRKLSEGSLEYDKQSAQYRNTSGREIESKVSGKAIQKGGYVDFETAADRLTGQSKRVRESAQNQINLKAIEKTAENQINLKAIEKTAENQINLKAIEKTIEKPTGIELKGKSKEKDSNEITGFGNLSDLGKAITARVTGIFDFMTSKVEKKSQDTNPGVTGKNPESDNVVDSQEIIADASKQDIELTKETNDIQKQQLEELVQIREALAPKTPSELPPQDKLKPTPGSAEAAESGGGINLGDALSGLGGLGKKAAGAVKRAGSALGRAGASVLKFAGSKGGMIAGGALAIGAGAYSAYKGFSAAEDSKQAKLEEVQNKLDTGEITPEQAAAERKEVGNTATVEKSEAVGEGTGMAAGAIGGMKAGAMIGTMIGGPIGTGIGALAGGALGAFAGSKAGKVAGEYAGKGINVIKGFFGGGKEDVSKSGKTELTSTVTGEKVQPELTSAAISSSGERIKVEGQQPATKTALSLTKVNEGVDYNSTKDGAGLISKIGKREDYTPAATVGSSAAKGTGVALLSGSVENNDLTRETAATKSSMIPIMSSSVNNVNTTSFTPIKAAPRNYTGSALDRYQDRVAVY